MSGPTADAAARAARRIATGYWSAGVLYVLARFRIADLLSGEPRSTEQLAEGAGVRADVLGRFLRAAVFLDVLVDCGNGTFRLTKLGQVLRGDVAGSVRDNVISVARWQRDAWHHDALEAALTGPGPGGWHAVHGRPFFDWLTDNPAEMAIFQGGMTARHASEPAAFVAAWDFSACRTVIDVGGGEGALLAAVLAAAPAAEGVLLDLPAAIARAPDLPRCRCIAHDFFHPFPVSGDLILLKRVLHDWNDEAAVRILANARSALLPGGCIVVLDGMLRSDGSPDPLALLDLHMLLLVGGRQRTQQEFASLFRQARLTLTQVRRLGPELAAIQADAAT
jgi:hypothetical protein